MSSVETTSESQAVTLNRPQIAAGALLILGGLLTGVAYVLLGTGHQVISGTVTAWLANCVILGSAVACLIRGCLIARDRGAWLLLGGGLAVWRLGDISAVGLFGSGSPYPGASDTLYGAFYLMSFGALALFARAHLRRLPAPIWLDGAIGALTVAAVWWALVGHPGALLSAGEAAGWQQLYPLADLSLAALVVGVGAASRWQLGRAVPLLGVGFLLAAATDSLHAATAAPGPNPVLCALWPIASVLFAAAAWQPPRPAGKAVTGIRILAAPVGLGALAVALLFLHEPLGLGELPAALAAASLVTVILRMAAGLVHSEGSRQILEAEAAKLRATETRLEEANRLAGLGHWEWDVTDDRITASAELYRITGLAPGPISIEAFLQLMQPEERRRVEHRIAETLEHGTPLSYEAEIERPDGGRRVLQVRGICSPSPAAAQLLGTAQDLTERRDREEALRQNVARREATERFMATVTESLAEGLCTLDKHGRITSANPTAAELLDCPADELVGSSLHDALHPECPAADTECDLAELHRLAEPIRNRETSLQRADARVIDIAFSASSFETNRGVGTVIVFQDISERKSEERALRKRLESFATVARTRTALEEGRLVLHSQPIIDLATGQAIEEELLIRMVDENGALVPPGDFLPAVEEHGFIRELDRWVVSQAACLASAGRRVGINLSGKSVGDAELLQTVEREIAKHDLDPDLLIFEITETALTSDIDRAEAFTRRLTALGCRLALDDFGTGYASFTYLKRLPISYLKIDREFIQQIRDDRANQHVVRAVVGLARDFGQRTIAEGVEDEVTLEFVRMLGVDYVQGFLFGRPEPVEMPSPMLSDPHTWRATTESPAGLGAGRA